MGLPVRESAEGGTPEVRRVEREDLGYSGWQRSDPRGS